MDVAASVDPAVASGSRAARWARLLLELSKARITFAVTFSVTTGWVVFRGSITPDLLLPVLGVFLLSCGSAALNQIQEWRTDARMERTRGRPIPAGRITPGAAGLVSALFLGAGFGLLALVENQPHLVLGLGAFAVVYYNGVYWALKRLTAFAVVPGALIGAVPPVIGWCAAGGYVFEGRILEIGGFFFIWQIPHFWLLVRIYGAQYEGAGLPIPTAIMSRAALQRMTVSWSLVTAVCGLFLTLRHQLAAPWNWLALGASLLVAWASVGYLRKDDPSPTEARRYFMQLNAYALAMMLLLMAGAIAR